MSGEELYEMMTEMQEVLKDSGKFEFVGECISLDGEKSIHIQTKFGFVGLVGSDLTV